MADDADERLGRVAEVAAVAPEPHVQPTAAALLAKRREAAGEQAAALATLPAEPAVHGRCAPPGLREWCTLIQVALLARSDDSGTAARPAEQLTPPRPLLFALVPAVSDAYWIFMTITTSVYLLMYLWMFIAYRLPKLQPDHPRGYRAPALTLHCVVGFIASLCAIGIGFVPPSQFGDGNPGCTWPSSAGESSCWGW